jgi:16S rRNA (guanine527-N7)-methyltransferase
VQDAAGLGVTLLPQQIDMLRRYLELLCEWNQRFNLTAIEQPAEILTKHFLDSLTCAQVLDLHAQASLVDVGTGAGFPGLVLKIVYPHLRVALIDSLQKRVRFLQRVVDALELRDVSALHARAEDAARADGEGGMREAFDVVSARAVARLNTLAEWILPFARVGGVALAMKGPHVGAEVTEAAAAVQRLGGGCPMIREFVLPRTDVGRSLVLIPKVRPTPKAYPRLPGSARKAPL